MQRSVRLVLPTDLQEIDGLTVKKNIIVQCDDAGGAQGAGVP